MNVSTNGPAGARTSLRMSMICLVTLVAWLTTFSPASAHDQLIGTDPADGSTLTEPPTAIRLTFNADVIAMGSSVAVTGPDGPVTVEAPETANHDLIVDLPELPAGHYDVAWRAVSSDGHPVDGTFAFTVAGSATPSATPTSTSPATTASPTSSSPSTASQDDGGSSPLRWIVPVVVVLVLLGAAALWRRSRTK